MIRIYRSRIYRSRIYRSLMILTRRISLISLARGYNPRLDSNMSIKWAYMCKRSTFLARAEPINSNMQLMYKLVAVSAVSAVSCIFHLGVLSRDLYGVRQVHRRQGVVAANPDLRRQQEQKEAAKYNNETTKKKNINEKKRFKLYYSYIISA